MRLSGGEIEYPGIAGPALCRIRLYIQQHPPVVGQRAEDDDRSGGVSEVESDLRPRCRAATRKAHIVRAAEQADDQVTVSEP